MGGVSKRSNRRAASNPLTGRSLGSKYLFSGRLTCAECGFHFQGMTSRKKDWAREGYICGGYKLRGKHTCKGYFLPSDIIEPAVLGALEKELKTLNLAKAVGRAGEELGKAPALADEQRAQIEGELKKVEERLDTLLDCITPENKDIISEKMVALRKERDRLRAELEQVGDISARAVASTKMVGRLLELAGNFQEMWAVATLAEKKEFLSFCTESLSISGKRKKATIHLSPNYLELKQFAAGVTPDSFLLDRRGGGI